MSLVTAINEWTKRYLFGSDIDEVESEDLIYTFNFSSAISVFLVTLFVLLSSGSICYLCVISVLEPYGFLHK